MALLSDGDLNTVLLKDAFSLKKLAQRAATDAQAAQAFTSLFQQSQQTYQQRQALNIKLDYPEQLPISQKRQAIADLIQQHPVVIVAGQTGSGKTTQLAKICLELGRGRRAMIGHTQPRRLAAIAVASRVGEELNHTQAVAHHVRFDDQSHDHTLVKLMTDGMLLAEIAHDRFLERYDTLIIDEAHERSLNIDFLLGYLKRLLHQRTDLKIIITSATIDVERFSHYFNHAPIIQVSGRSFPVEIRYRPLDASDDSLDLYQGIIACVDEIEQLEKQGQGQYLGDILVFLSGEADIRHCAQALRQAQLPHCDILPLYARLPRAQQQKIFQPAAKKALRRIILATNVAETSLTVPGIHYVIDSGLARISRYSHKSKVQRLPIEKISQASANQRSGRCGRLAAGIAFRLYDEADFARREEFTEAEIKRTNLSSVILQMQALRLGDINHFDFIDRPDQRLINDGIKQLTELAAFNDKQQLSAIGKQMALLPLDPRLSRILISANQLRCLNEALVIVAMLSSQDPRDYNNDKRQAAQEKHSQFKHAQSDFLSFYQLWQFIEQQRQALSGNTFKKLCQQYYLSFVRIKEWRETHRQLKLICHNLQFKENHDAADYASLHQALLSGLLLNIGFQHEKQQFIGTRQRQFRIFPSSFIGKKPAKWIVAAELIETSQLYAHYVAEIEPEWVLKYGKHLLKFHYHEPYFSAKQGQVLVLQEASLYGLVISDKRRISFSAINPELSREIFIRSALVEQQLNSTVDFYQHNKALRESIENLEEKSRRRDLLVSDDWLYDFYHQRLPASVNNAQSLLAWYKKASPAEKQALFAQSDLLHANQVDNAEAQYPDHIHYQGTDYALSYCFEPGQPNDGVSVDIPIALLNRLPVFCFDYLVPGMLLEKCEALLKTLPKALRKPLLPIPDTAAQLLSKITRQNKPLTSVLSELIKQQKGLNIQASDWQSEKLDSWYQMNFRLLDEQGKLLKQSRDLTQLSKQFAQQAQSALKEHAPKKLAQRYFTAWQFEDLKPSYQFKQGELLLTAYPAIKDEGDKISLQLNSHADEQQAMHRQGLCRLALLSLNASCKYLKKNLLNSAAVQLKLGAQWQKEALLDDVLMAACQSTFFSQQLVWSKRDFELCLEKNRAQLTHHAQQLEQLLIQIIELNYALTSSLQALEKNAALAYAVKDIKQQREALLAPHFMRQTAPHYLSYYPRYFKAIAYRLERLGGQQAKDQAATHELAFLLQRYQQLLAQQPRSAELPAMQEYRCLLEEYRVSLFAQPLKTAVRVSRKRLDEVWQAIENAIEQGALSHL